MSETTEATTGTSYSDILSPPPAAPAEETAAPESTPVTAAVPAKAPEVVATPEPENDLAKQANGFKQGMLEERRKRQEAEAQLARLTAPPPPPQVPYFEDPEQFVTQRLNQTEQAVVDRLAAMSEMQARNAHPDYDQKFEAFAEVAKTNPALYQQVMSSPVPGEAAYQQGKRILFEKEYGSDPESILKTAKAKVRAEVEAEIEQKLLGKVAKKVNQPTNILGARAAGGDSAPEFRPSGWGDVIGKRTKR